MSRRRDASLNNVFAFHALLAGGLYYTRNQPCRGPDIRLVFFWHVGERERHGERRRRERERERERREIVCVRERRREEWCVRERNHAVLLLGT